MSILKNYVYEKIPIKSYLIPCVLIRAWATIRNTRIHKKTVWPFLFLKIVKNYKIDDFGS